jgi:predicted nucleic acid-binding protein
VIVLDTGPIFAAANRRDRDHRACARLIADTPTMAVPTSVIAEACYLIGTHLGPKVEASFIRSLRTDRFVVVDPTDADLGRAAELVLTYGDLPLGGTDAFVVATAERLGVATIATLDRRHFAVVRPSHVDSFELVP